MHLCCPDEQTNLSDPLSLEKFYALFYEFIDKTDQNEKKSLWTFFFRAAVCGTWKAIAAANWEGAE